MWLTEKDITLPGLWGEYLLPEFDCDYMQSLLSFLNERHRSNAVIYPSSDNCFSAFRLTPLEKVSVVVLGQDPYHGPGQAHGLSFSVPKGIKEPPSLKNIYKEIETDLSIPSPSHGCLEDWARQGVFLLNSVLTVEQSKAGAHQGKGWEKFTDRVISILNETRESLVFLLWGSYAQKKAQFLDRERHCILEGPHPSPLSAYRGFLGCRHFSNANRYLQSHNKQVIDWAVH